MACATSNLLELWDYAPDTLTLHKWLLLAPYHDLFESTPDGVYVESDNQDAELGARGIAVSVIDTQVQCFCVDETDTTFYCVMAAPDHCIGVVSI